MNEKNNFIKKKTIKTLFIAFLILLPLYFQFSSMSLKGEIFNIIIKNISDNQQNNIIVWSNITVSSQGWIIAKQYIEVNYLTNHSIITGWGLQIYTHNTTNIANPQYKGSEDNPAGLIDTEYSNRILSLAWLIKENLSIPQSPIEANGNFTTPDWHWMLDKHSSSFTNAKDYIDVWNQAGIAWHTAVRQRKPLTAYIYLAAKFQNLIPAVYRTSQLRFEEYHDSDNPKFLNNFYIYTNKWEDLNPVPNHYTPAWEDWGGGTTTSADFGYSNVYHSPNTCIKISFPAGTKGAWVWYEPGSDWSCPSGKGYGYDLTGAGKLTFWIKGSNTYSGIIAQIGVNGDSCGIIQNVDGTGSDTFNITTNWVKHYIPVTNKNMSYVSRGFKIGVWEPSQNVVIYIDNIKYER